MQKTVTQKDTFQTAVFKQIKHDRGLTYTDMGKQIGYSSTRIIDTEAKAKRILTRVLDQPEPYYFLDKALNISHVQRYMKDFHLNKDTLTRYIIDALGHNDWPNPLTDEQRLTYGIEVLELNERDYNALIRWSNIRKIDQLLKKSQLELKHIRGMTNTKTTRILERLTLWSNANGINITDRPIIAESGKPEPSLKNHYGTTSTEPIAVLNLQKRINTALNTQSITTIDDLLNQSVSELDAIPNIGHGAIQNITRALNKYFKNKKYTQPPTTLDHIRTLGIKTTAVNGLSRRSITTIQALLNTPYTDIKALYGVGPKVRTNIMTGLRDWSNTHGVPINDSILIQTKNQYDH